MYSGDGFLLRRRASGGEAEGSEGRSRGLVRRAVQWAMLPPRKQKKEWVPNEDLRKRKGGRE
jgi:hypothetical protein